MAGISTAGTFSKAGLPTGEAALDGGSARLAKVGQPDPRGETATVPTLFASLVDEIAADSFASASGAPPREADRRWSQTFEPAANRPAGPDNGQAAQIVTTTLTTGGMFGEARVTSAAASGAEKPPYAGQREQRSEPNPESSGAPSVQANRARDSALATAQMGTATFSTGRVLGNAPAPSGQRERGPAVAGPPATPPASSGDQRKADDFPTSSVPPRPEEDDGPTQAVISATNQGAAPNTEEPATNQHFDETGSAAPAGALPESSSGDLGVVRNRSPAATEEGLKTDGPLRTGPRLGKPDRSLAVEEAGGVPRMDVSAPAVVVAPIRPKPLDAAGGEDGDRSAPKAAAMPNQPTNEVLGPEVAVEIRLHPKETNSETLVAVKGTETPDNTEPFQPPPTQPDPAQPGPAADVRSEPKSAVPETLGHEVLVAHDRAVTAERAIQDTGVQLNTPQREAQVIAEVRPEPVPGHAKSQPEVHSAATADAPAGAELKDAKSQPQTLRSLALEFTPDGAEDVRVRVTEKGGTVHISLHSADDSLSGRLREGVHDLVGSLTSAGYDADAWTPGHGRNQQDPRESVPQRRNNRQNESAAAEFSGLIDPTTQENL
jgi:hypothetical protein